MKKLLTERFQELAGIRPLYQLNESNPTVFNGNGKVRDVLGQDATTEENSTTFRSTANGGKVELQIEYMWKGEGVLQIWVSIGDDSKIQYKHSDGVDLAKVLKFIEEIKPNIKETLELDLGKSDAKEYLGKIHIGSGYEDKITDEDIAIVKAGIEKFNTLKPSKL